MVFSNYLLKIPYSLVWHLYKLFGKLIPVVFYCGDPVDYHVFLPVAKYLDEIVYVTDKPKVKTYLAQKGIKCKSLPVYPRCVIMARHSTHKFPYSKICRIGMRHGAYHFKRMTSPENYNQFNLYLMTSKMDVNAAKEMGIISAKAVGFPKLDPAFNGEITAAALAELRSRLGFNNGKPIVLFSATYDSSGMSAISFWCNNLHRLTEKWNVMVTLHSWIKPAYKDKINNTPDVYLIKDYDTLPYIMLADITVGDTSSILAECCALDKPIITLYLGQAKRSLKEIRDLIDAISYKVKSFADLEEKLNYVLTHKDELKPYRTVANAIFFDELDGKAGFRASNEIKALISREVN